MVSIGFLTFTAAMIALQFFIGSAIVGWAGDNMVVDRSEKPGPYWFSIAIQAAMWSAFAAIWVVSQLRQ
jgi:hypothetical protein